MHQRPEKKHLPFTTSRKNVKARGLKPLVLFHSGGKAFTVQRVGGAASDDQRQLQLSAGNTRVGTSNSDSGLLLWPFSLKWRAADTYRQGEIWAADNFPCCQELSRVI